MEGLKDLGRRGFLMAAGVGLALATAYWIVDSLIMSFVLARGSVSLLLFRPDPDDLWMRSFTGGVLVLASLAWFRGRGRNARLLRLAEERTALLVESNERYQTAAKASRQILYDWDSETGVVLLDGWVEELLGYRGGEIPNTLEAWESLIHPDDCAGFRAEIERILATRAPADTAYRVRHEDGSYISVLDRGHFFYDRSGRAVRMVGFVTDVTEQHGREEALERSRQALRRLASELETRREADLSRLSREIHDEVGSIATAIQLDLSWLRTQLRPAQAELTHKVDATLVLTEALAESIRQISMGLRPRILGDFGLGAALHWLAERFDAHHPARVTVRWPDDLPELGPQRATAAFRIVQEALQNVARHAGATAVWVAAELRNGSLELTVRDDGCGLGPSAGADTGPKVGILGMKERALEAGGTLTVTGAPGKGTTVQLVLPLG